MISDENIEIEVCDEDLNVELKDVDRDDHQDDGSLEQRAPIYLTASELFNLRRDVCKNKGKDEDVDVYKGPKHYVPSDTSQDEENMKSILENHRKSLNLQRGSKMRDCMKAEWNEELKVAIVAHLKGKTTQHMGRTFKGKVALSPEEALYLLEKNCIEIKRNNMPMSVEEAYTVMLKGKLDLEKYQLYSHLSQQGFLVVRHQAKVGSKHVEINSSKQNHKKRKAVNGTSGEPLEKRLTFSGVLASNTKENVSAITEGSTLSSECEVLNSSDSFNKSDLVPEDILNLNTDKVSCDLTNVSEKAELVISQNDALSPDTTYCVNFVEKDLLSIPLVSVCTNKDLSVDKVDELMDASNLPVSSVENEKECLLEVSPRIEMSLKLDEPEVLGKEQVNEDTVKICDDNIHEAIGNENDGKKDAICDNNGTEVQDVNDDTNDVIIEGEHKSEKNNEINVDDSLSSYYDIDEVTDDSIPAVCDESSEDLDVLSCSTGDQPSMFDGLKSISSNDIFEHPVKEHDDEVTLVEIKKKENTPLAVIDLLSDEEENVEKCHEIEMYEGSDDDIQVVKVCPATRNTAQSSSRNLNSVKSECKAERSVIKSNTDIKTDFHLKMKLPDLFRKEVLCVSRPSVTLLPNNVRPAKEVYVINYIKTPKPRVWNSFRDMEDYQRDRRLQRQSNNSNSIKPFNSLRDYRFHNDLHAHRMNSFNREEHALDSNFERNNQNFERNNQNFAFGQSRNSFNSPLSMSHEAHPVLRPGPGDFNSPNHMPFMNIPNMQSLSSSNPAAIVNEIQRTVHSVASSILTSMLGQHMNHMNPAVNSSPTFNEPPMMSHNSHHFNNFSASSPMITERPPFNAMRSDFHPMRFPTEPMFPEERAPYGMRRETLYDSAFALNCYRQRNSERKGPLFPRAYRQVHRKRCWNDIKAKGSSAKESDSGSDIEEVPINLNQFLWSNDIQPLVKPGTKLPVSEVLQKLRITQMADLLDEKKNNDRYLPNPPGLEISFDVYLPGFKYKKTAPDVPKHRIVLLRSGDPIPKYSEIVVLQRKWNDGAMLQMAVVDHGDISFYSFNSVVLPDLVPHES